MEEKQIQKLDYTQLQKQKQDLVHCNNSFGMLLSSMESLFIKSGYEISVLFGDYNYFNDITWKTKDEIRAQLYTDLLAYKIQKLAYTQKYKKFDYPDHPPISEIIKIIKKWKEMAKNKDEKSLCDEILELINDSNQKPISYYQSRVESIKSNSKCDPVEQVKMSNKIHDKIDKRNEEINKKIKENPDTKFGLKIGGKAGNGEFSDIKKSCKNNKNKKNDENLMKKENVIVNNINELIGSFDKYIKLKNKHEEEIQKNIIKTSSIIDEYYKDKKDIDFIYTKIHKDSTIKHLEEQIKTFNDGIQIFYNMIQLLKKYEEC